MSACLFRFSPVRRMLATALAIVALPDPASADIIIPVIAGPPFFMVILLLPAIVVEGFVVWWLMDLTFLSAMGLSAGANLLSTIIGIPVSFLLARPMSGFVENIVERLQIGKVKSEFTPLGMRPSIWNEYWNGRELTKGREWLGWATEAVVYLTVLACFLASWGFETYFYTQFLETHLTREIARAAFFANFVTYGVLSFVFVKNSRHSYRDHQSSLQNQIKEDARTIALRKAKAVARKTNVPTSRKGSRNNLPDDP